MLRTVRVRDHQSLERSLQKNAFQCPADHSLLQIMKFESPGDFNIVAWREKSKRLMTPSSARSYLADERRKTHSAQSHQRRRTMSQVTPGPYGRHADLRADGSRKKRKRARVDAEAASQRPRATTKGYLLG